MTISSTPARAFLALAASAALLFTAGFGLAKADDHRDVNRGNGDLTKTTTALRSGLRVGRSKIITGTASFYGEGFDGKRTFTGERFNMRAMTLACRRLPMGTRVRVTNLRNGKSVVGRVNDRGPNGRFRRTRVADLSKGMARKIGFTDGLTRVRMEVIEH